NALAGRRIAIVDSVPGVTRDRISAPVPVGDSYVELLDTGGFGIEDRDNLTDHINQQIDLAVASADLILFLVDAREGLQPLDRAVAEKLRRHGKGLLLVANKIDIPGAQLELGELHGLGAGEPIPISATHGQGLADLTDAIAERLGPGLAERPDEPNMKLAIIGKRNVGKSTFINALAGSERVIVSEVPGTTRDSIDVRIELDGRTLLAIDTAGMRKRSKVADDVEYYSQHRALRSIRRADVVLFMMDATDPVGRVEKNLLQYVTELFKPVVLVLNKWDLAEDRADRDDYIPYLAEVLPELAYAPVLLACAATGMGIREAVELAGELFDQTRTRVPTPELNNVVQAMLARHSPKRGRTHRPGRVYYVTQVAVAPPTLVLFVNDVSCFDATYRRYLLNQLRQHLPFTEIPIRLIIRPRRRDPDRERPPQRERP
ncbi:hypothetical protein LCGC14_2688200, partial [marine sediment metagenome]